MKQTFKVFLLLCMVLLPVASWAQDCQPYENELDSVLDRSKELSKQYNSNERVLSEEEAATLYRELQALGKRSEAAQQKLRECMGWPSPNDAAEPDSPQNADK